MRKLSVAEYPLGELESGYRRHYLVQDIRQSIIVGSVWLIPNFIFIYADYLLYAGQPLFLTLAGIRLFLLFTVSISCLLMQRIKQPATYDHFVFVASLFALVGVFYVNHLQPAIRAHTAGIDYLILFSIYLLIPNRFSYRILLGFAFTIASLADFFFLTVPLPGPIIAIVTTLFLLANLLGLWASMRFYSHRRQQYEAQARAAVLRKDLIQTALVDQLTGVANRRHFFQNAEAEFERFLRYKRPFSVLMLDLDHFKYVNDRFGHPAGDKILKDIAATIGRCKRDTDIFGRLGGEEFALLLPETSLSGATDIAVRLRRACHTVALPDSSSSRITVSIGVTQVRADDANFDEVLSRADETLYRAKNNGRDRVEVA